MPAPTFRMKPARERRTWLTFVASAGASFIVGMRAREKSMGPGQIARLTLDADADAGHSGSRWVELARVLGLRAAFVSLVRRPSIFGTVAISLKDRAFSPKTAAFPTNSRIVFFAPRVVSFGHASLRSDPPSSTLRAAPVRLVPGPSPLRAARA